MIRFALRVVWPIFLAVSIPSVSFAQDWYIHQTSEEMSEPPWYCYCYRMTQANTIPGLPTHPVEMQIPYELALSRLAAYAAASETCFENCGLGSTAAIGGGGGAGGGGGTGGTPPTPPVPSRPDLSGRWVADGDIVDFVAGPGEAEFTAEFTANQSSFDIIMRYMPSGRVRLQFVMDGQVFIATEGDLVIQGAAGRSDYQLVFDAVPGTSETIVFSPL